MSLTFEPTKFGFNTPAAATPAADRPKAELWLNLGYETEHINEETGKPYFISLPQGIPLDTMEPADTNIRSPEFAAIRNAQNSLLEQLQDYCKDLAPGEDKLITLTVQVRRVKAPVAPIDPANNPLVKKLSFS